MVGDVRVEAFASSKAVAGTYQLRLRYNYLSSYSAKAAEEGRPTDPKNGGQQIFLSHRYPNYFGIILL
ncbi:hypothetical protein CHS0354_003481 [Potamilus streckersoni]|uniref:Uncharacterized protein n=1 Tax=Potamilus streckersoni TaxID=2493646 RepID=A0AAE0SYI1_9BIVA|nr:hypothetical protein CHS0354_003481 [Potamilus streckersoni]